jgi:hypothetical protein
VQTIGRRWGQCEPGWTACGSASPGRQSARHHVLTDRNQAWGNEIDEKILYELRVENTGPGPA